MLIQHAALQAASSYYDMNFFLEIRRQAKKKEDDLTQTVIAAPYSQKGWCHAYE